MLQSHLKLLKLASSPADFLWFEVHTLRKQITYLDNLGPAFSDYDGS